MLFDEEKEENFFVLASWTHQILSLLQASKLKYRSCVFRSIHVEVFEKRNDIKGERKKERYV